MLIAFKIALRYLFSKKSINAINIIAGISTVGVAIATAALIIILSAFNGLEQIIISRFNAFNPELKVSLNEGKFFNINDTLIQKLESIKNIKHFSFVMEDYAAIKVGKITNPFPIKGVDANYQKVCGIDSMFYDGQFELKDKKGNDMAVVGYEVAQRLSIGVSFVSPIVIYAPKRNKKVSMNPVNAFNKKYLYPSGIFTIDESADNRIILNLALVQDLFEAPNKATNIEISLFNNELSMATQEQLQQRLGSQFKVQNRQEQNSFYKILNSERLMIYLILSFVLLMTAFNIVATLTMLIVDKKNDFLSFKSIGFNNYQIKMIFLLNGWLTIVIGAILGLILGGLLTFIQQKYGMVSFGDGFDMQAYPVDLKFFDFVKTFSIVLIIGLITSLLPVRRFTQNYLQ